jgi:DNA (cytosine-5)-methyltransferase 1
MAAYYNEIDPFAAQWLRNLIEKKLIAPGDVDERSIRDVKPDDLRNYTQCHFFAGIGVWSYALRRSGWTDDLPVWTGSCPCQPFSAAGKQEGTADARHLWPEWFRLIREHRPVAVFGEQVAAAIRHDWLDLVSADLEGAGYAVGAAVLGAHSVGAPHIRQRLYFVANANAIGHSRPVQEAPGAEGRGAAESHLRGQAGELADAERGAAERHGHELAAASRGMQGAAREQWLRADAGDGRHARELAHTDGRNSSAEGLQRGGEHGFEPQDGGADTVRMDDTTSPRQQPAGRRPEGEARDETRLRGLERGCGEGGMEHAAGEQVGIPGRARESRSANGVVGDTEIDGRQGRHLPETAGRPESGVAASGFWSACDWLPCIDGKARPVEPGAFPLAHGAPARVGRLRAYGNAINAETAAAFIEAYLGR